MWSRIAKFVLLGGSLGSFAVDGSTITRIDVRLSDGPLNIYTIATGSFSPISWSLFPKAVDILYADPTGDVSPGNHFQSGTFATVAFEAPNDAPPRPGMYRRATQFPFASSGQPGLDITLDHVGGSRPTGEFTVFQAIYGTNGGIQSLGASFNELGGNGQNFSGDAFYNFDPNGAAPEPGSLALLCLSVCVLLFKRCKGLRHT